MASPAAGTDARRPCATVPAGSEAIIRLDRASLTYGGPNGVMALMDAELEVAAGELVAVVGPS